MLGTMNIGECIGGYLEVIDLLGMGGQYLVAKARDIRNGMIVVVRKPLVAPGQNGYPQHAGRAKRESRIRIGHPGVADPIAAWEKDGEWLIVTPFVEGEGLDVVLNRCGGHLTLQQAHPLVARLADALGAVHRKGYIHRDIKLDNIIIRPDGTPVIIDFGIAKARDGVSLTMCDQVLGSTECMSPEQLEDASSVDRRSDLYSFGTVAYRLLTGRLTVKSGSPVDVLLSIPQYVPPSPRTIIASIPPHMDQAIMRLLAKNRDARFGTAEEFLAAWNGRAPASLPSPTFCLSCGASIQPGGNFCLSCGAGIKDAPNAHAFCFACGAAAGEVTHCPKCHRSFGHSNHRLHFLSGTMTGRIFRVPEGKYEVGRDELSPRDGHISRRHLRVMCSNGTVQLEDAGSTNKTYVAGRQVDRPVLLRRGLEIVIAGNVASYSSN